MIKYKWNHYLLLCRKFLVIHSLFSHKYTKGNSRAVFECKKIQLHTEKSPLLNRPRCDRFRPLPTTQFCISLYDFHHPIKRGMFPKHKFNASPNGDQKLKPPSSHQHKTLKAQQNVTKTNKITKFYNKFINTALML